MRIFLENVPDEYMFRLHKGGELKNLKELAEALERMEDDVFNHHVNEMRNDFHNWIKDIVLDLQLAEKLMTVEDSAKAAKIIRKRIDDIESRLKGPVKKRAKKSAKKSIRKSSKKSVKKKNKKSVKKSVKKAVRKTKRSTVKTPKKTVGKKKRSKVKKR